MKKHLILFLILVSVLGSHAQDWKLFQIGEKYNYSMGNMPFFSTIWIDSTAFINNDSVYYFNKVLKKVRTGTNWQYPNFYLNDQSQFFLSKLSFGDSKELQFIENDSIKFLIKPLANLNEQWVFDSYSNITATIVSKDEVSIFGEMDSVKVIALSNADTIIISKFHSFLKFPLFDTTNQHVVLAGIEGRNLGSQVPTFSDFFDFDPTDVFYYTYHSYMGNYGHFETDAKEKITVLNKTISNDSIIYHCSYKAVVNRYDYLSIPPNRIFYFSEPDTLFIYIDSVTNFLNKYPNQILNNPLIGETYKPIIVDFDTIWNTIIKSYPNNNFCKNSYIGSGDTIVEAAGPFGCKEEAQNQVYGVHLGIIETYYLDPDVMGGNSISNSRTLVGYIHDGQQQGIIYNDSIFENTNEINEHAEESFKLYPNPVKDLLLIEMDYDNNPLLLIYNSSGGLIYSKAIISDKTEINLSGLQSGLYILKVISDKAVVTRKLIKE